MACLCFVDFSASERNLPNYIELFEIYFVLISEKLNCAQPPTPPTLNEPKLLRNQ